jgi:hypothetical protein
MALGAPSAGTIRVASERSSDPERPCYHILHARGQCIVFGHRTHVLNRRWPLPAVAARIQPRTQSARAWLPTPALLCALFAPACVHSSAVDETDASERDERVNDAECRLFDHMRACARTWCEECSRGWGDVRTADAREAVHGVAPIFHLASTTLEVRIPSLSCLRQQRSHSLRYENIMSRTKGLR